MFAHHSGELTQKLQDQLREELGSPMVVTQTAPEENAIEKLKRLKGSSNDGN